MSESIFTLLSRQPDESVGENVFFHTSFDEDLKNWISPERDSNNIPLYQGVEGYHMWMRQKNLLDFSKFHKNGVLWARENDLRYFSWGWDQMFHDILSEIAYSGEVILDVASSFSMGLLPIILNYNPSAYCYASDRDEQSMKTLSECLNEHLAQYNIRVASFDNNNIPLRDNSINYITSIHGMTSSQSNSKDIPIIGRCLGQDKAVSEIYRILKTGGYFVTVEQFLDCNFDLQKIEEHIQKNGKLFGIYSFEEIKMFMEWVHKDSWKRSFSSVGFHIEKESVYSRKLTVYDLKRLLFRYTYFSGIHCWNDMDITLNCMSKELFEVIHNVPSSEQMLRNIAFRKEWGIVNVISFNNNYSMEDLAEMLWKNVKSGVITEWEECPENIGMDVYAGETVYVLRK